MGEKQMDETKILISLFESLKLASEKYGFDFNKLVDIVCDKPTIQELVQWYFECSDYYCHCMKHESVPDSVWIEITNSIDDAEQRLRDILVTQ